MAIFLLIFVFIVIVAYLTIVFLRIIAPIGSRCAFRSFVFFVSHSRSLCFINDHYILNGIMQFRCVYINKNKNENRNKDNNNGMSENHNKNQQTFHNVSVYYICGTEL